MSGEENYTGFIDDYRYSFTYQFNQNASPLASTQSGFHPPNSSPMELNVGFTA